MRPAESRIAPPQRPEAPLPYRRASGGRTEALFLGWFGPIGVAALFYANLSVREAGVEEAWVVGSLIICASILAHGLSATPLTRLYGRRAQNDGTRE